MEGDPKIGDKVALMREPDRIGTVVEIEPDQHSFDDPIFHTVWTENGPAIPIRRHHYIRVVQRNESPFVLILPNSKTNRTRQYLVTTYEAWRKCADGETTALDVISRHGEYDAASAARDKANEGLHND